MFFEFHHHRVIPSLTIHRLSGNPLRAMKGKRAQKKRGLFFSFFVLIVIVLALFAVFGDKGLVDVYRLAGERDRILAFNRSLEKENRELKKKIALLRTDRRFIERTAREELGMIGGNEVIYMIED